MFFFIIFWGERVFLSDFIGFYWVSMVFWKKNSALDYQKSLHFGRGFLYYRIRKFVGMYTGELQVFFFTDCLFTSIFLRNDWGSGRSKKILDVTSFSVVLQKYQKMWGGGRLPAGNSKLPSFHFLKISFIFDSFKFYLRGLIARRS